MYVCTGIRASFTNVCNAATLMSHCHSKARRRLISEQGAWVERIWARTTLPERISPPGRGPGVGRRAGVIKASLNTRMQHPTSKHHNEVFALLEFHNNGFMLRGLCQSWMHFHTSIHHLSARATSRWLVSSAFKFICNYKKSYMGWWCTCSASMARI
jgi:hypothetical protein